MIYGFGDRCSTIELFPFMRPVCQARDIIYHKDRGMSIFFDKICLEKVTVQPTRLTTASNIGYMLAGAVPVGSAIRLH